MQKDKQVTIGSLDFISGSRKVWTLAQDSYFQVLRPQADYLTFLTLRFSFVKWTERGTRADVLGDVLI